MIDYTISLGSIFTIVAVIVSVGGASMAIILKIGAIETKVEAMWQVFLRRLNGSDKPLVP